jgi:molybdopterin synthase catalytic subunit
VNPSATASDATGGGASMVPAAAASIAPAAAARVRIQPQDFDVARECAAVREGDARVGAVAAFIGTVRDRSAGSGPADTTGMELEHYPGMTEASIEAMIDEAMRRFAIVGARVVHRVGALMPGDQIVLVVVASSHRGEAFEACEFLMDYLKTQAPFWKKEHRPDGSAEWVDARVADDAALARWGLASANALPAPAR